MRDDKIHTETIGQNMPMGVYDADFAPAVIPEQSKAVSVKSPLPVCPHCGNHYEPEGKETLCWECLERAEHPLTCANCGGEFRSDDIFAAHCGWCASMIYATSRPLYEADYRFDPSTDT